MCGVFFFFSSRRRHTRLQGDWSSDVCSSDLPLPSPLAGLRRQAEVRLERAPALRELRAGLLVAHGRDDDDRSEERRVGEEGRSRGAPYHLKKKKKIKL